MWLLLVFINTVYIILNKHRKAYKKSKKSESLITQLNNEDTLNGELETYVSMLTGNKEGGGGEGDDQQSDSDSDDDDDSEDNRKGSKRPLQQQRAMTRDEPSKAAKVDKWFSNPIFKTGLITDDKTIDFSGDKKKSKIEPKTRDEVTLDMPKTDREKRKDARKKTTERMERKLSKRQAKNEKDTGEETYTDKFEIVKQSNDETYDRDGKVISDTPEMLKYKDLIKKGLGKQATGKYIVIYCVLYVL